MKWLIFLLTVPIIFIICIIGVAGWLLPMLGMGLGIAHPVAGAIAGVLIMVAYFVIVDRKIDAEREKAR